MILFDYIRDFNENGVGDPNYDPDYEPAAAIYPATFSSKNWADLDIVVKSKLDGSSVPFVRSEDGWYVTVTDGPDEGVIVESID